MVGFLPKILKYLIIVFIIFLQGLLFCLYSQFYNTGTAPLSVKWYQLKTNDFTVIYPKEIDSSAYEFSKFLQSSFNENNKFSKSTDIKPFKVILYNQNTLSNGYVSFAPKRMELVTTPPQKNYSQVWLAQLALHEYKHVLQLNTLNQGFTKGLSFLLGEIAPGMVTGFLPLWYLEGDAVVAETVFSASGRGREPDFYKEIKAIELYKEKRYSYDQAYLGTYRGFAPDHYRYGYQMVAWSNKKFGTDAFTQTINFVGRNPFMVAPFYFGLKKYTGLSKVELYENTFNELKNNWLNENLIPDLSGNAVETTYPSKFVSYKYPYYNGKGNIIALRTSIDDIDRFVNIKDKKEEIICNVGVFKGDQIAYSETFIAWEEYQADIRREQKNYSVIRIYNKKQKSSFILKKKARHFSPSISANEEKIAAVNTNIRNISSISIYSLNDRLKISEFFHPDSLFLSYNSWINDSLIAIVCLGDNGKSIYTLNTYSGKWDNLFGPVFYNISELNANSNFLLFTYTIDGTQNIYGLNLKNKSVFQITKSNLAANFGSFCKNNSKILYSEYNYSGYKLVKKEFYPQNSIPLNKVQPYKYKLADDQSELTEYNIQDTVINNIDCEIKKYNRIGNALNLHSWIIPFYVDIQDISSSYQLQDFKNNTYLGFNLFSQNMLSTLTSSIGYHYKDGHHHLKPIIYYTGLYPKISLEFDLGGDLIVFRENDTVSEQPPQTDYYKSIKTKVEFPFNFTSSRFAANLNTGISFRYTNIYLSTPYKYDNLSYASILNGNYFYRGLFTTDYYISFYLASRTSYKDINPRWGISTYFSTLHSFKSIPYHELWESDIIFSTFYLPGFFRHHSIKFRFSGEEGLGNRINGQNLPRGAKALTNTYNYIYATRKYVVEYTFPWLYPDLSIGPLAYLKRIHSNLFYDYLNYYSGLNDNGNVRKFSKSIYSYGAEIGIETHFFRFFIPVTPIFRYSYVPFDQAGKFEFYVSSNFKF